MSKGKTNKQPFQKWESNHENGRYIRFADEMQESKAWKQLSISQIGLYHILKSKYSKKTDEDDISMPKSEWIKYYSKKTPFDKAMNSLIDLGFIKVVKYQGNLRKPTIYGYSDQWKNYGTDKFNISKCDKRPKDTLTKEHKKAISEGAKKSLEKRYTPVKLKVL